MPPTDHYPFRRLFVDHMIEGGGRIWWEMSYLFADPRPHTFQVQVGNTGLTAATDWLNVGSPVANGYFAIDDQKRQYGMMPLTHYRVQLTTPVAQYVSHPVTTTGILDERNWVLAREILRKEELRSTNFVATAGYLLKRLRFGRRCERCTDELTGEITNSRCPECRGVGYKTGYHPSVPLTNAIEPEFVQEQRNATQAPGQIRLSTVAGRVNAFPQLASEDVWVDGTSDQRWVLEAIQHTAAIRGVPLISNLKLNLLPYTDVAYRIPIGGEADDSIWSELPTAGTGAERIDHDYGGEDNLAYRTPTGEGIVGATVLAVTLENYNAGLRDARYATAATTTEANGRWAFAMLLDPGDYMLIYQKFGEYGPDAAELLVIDSCDSSSSTGSLSSDLSY